MQQDGQVVQRPVEAVPAEHTDFIFAVTGAELWAGLLLVLTVALVALVAWRRRRQTPRRGDASSSHHRAG